MIAASKGFSGEGYEGWAEEPELRVRVSDVRMVDLAAAELMLDDGRTILVDLTGVRVEDEEGRAVITSNLSDPALAEMDLADHGFEASAEHVCARTTVSRILSIQLNTGVGYAVSSAIQAVNAIMNTRSDNGTQWLSLYLITAKSFDVERHSRPEQVRRFRGCRADVVLPIEEGTPEYLRPARFDAILYLVFPTLARGLASGRGRMD